MRPHFQRLGLRVFFVLHFSDLYFHAVFFVLYFLCDVYSLNSQLTLTIQNIDVTQETTAKLRSKKSDSRQTYSKPFLEEKNGVDPECNQDIQNV